MVDIEIGVIAAAVVWIAESTTPSASSGKSPPPAWETRNAAGHPHQMDVHNRQGPLQNFSSLSLFTFSTKDFKSLSRVLV